VAAAVASTSRQVGQALGVAIVGSILGYAAAGASGAGLAGASHPAWWLIAGCGVAVMALGTVSTGAWALRTARSSAEQFAAEPPAAAVPAG
jgi:NAD/NADP transhydrogenase alpha subunit